MPSNTVFSLARPHAEGGPILQGARRVCAVEETHPGMHEKKWMGREPAPHRCVVCAPSPPPSLFSFFSKLAAALFPQIHLDKAKTDNSLIYHKPVPEEIVPVWTDSSSMSAFGTRESLLRKSAQRRLWPCARADVWHRCDNASFRCPHVDTHRNTADVDRPHASHPSAKTTRESSFGFSSDISMHTRCTAQGCAGSSTGRNLGASPSQPAVDTRGVCRNQGQEAVPPYHPHTKTAIPPM